MLVADNSSTGGPPPPRARKPKDDRPLKQRLGAYLINEGIAVSTLNAIILYSYYQLVGYCINMSFILVVASSHFIFDRQCSRCTRKILV
jgi:hypothetical protein